MQNQQLEKAVTSASKSSIARQPIGQLRRRRVSSRVGGNRLAGKLDAEPAGALPLHHPASPTPDNKTEETLEVEPDDRSPDIEEHQAHLSDTHNGETLSDNASDYGTHIDEPRPERPMKKDWKDRGLHHACSVTPPTSNHDFSAEVPLEDEECPLTDGQHLLPGTIGQDAELMVPTVMLLDTRRNNQSHRREFSAKGLEVEALPLQVKGRAVSQQVEAGSHWHHPSQSHARRLKSQRVVRRQQERG